MRSRVMPIGSIKEMLLVWAALAACSPGAGDGLRPIDARTVSSTLEGALSDHSGSIAHAIELIQGARFLEDLDRALFVSDGSDCSEAAEATCANEPDDGLEQDAAELANEIVEHLFPEQAIESSSNTEIVYRVEGYRVCDEPLGTPNDCARSIDELALRLRVTSPADGVLEIAVLVGDSRGNPTTLRIGVAEVSVDVDLGALADVLEQNPSTFDIHPDDLPSVMEGGFTIALRRNDERDYTASLAVTDSIVIESSRSDGPYALTIAAGPVPLLAIGVDAEARRATLDAAFGAIDATTAFSMVSGLFEQCEAPSDGADPACERPTLLGTLGFHLAGLTGHAVLDVGLERLMLSGLGFGTEQSRITLDGLDLVTFDLNALASRTVDVGISGGTDAIEVTVSPSLTLAVGLDLARIADQVDDVPAWMLHDRASVSFSGDPSPALLIPRSSDDLGGLDLVLGVLRGTLTLASSTLAEPTVIGSGACMFVDETRTTSEDGIDDHPFSLLRTASCPQ